MYKQILSNQKGMSLVEVIVASAISIIIAMGVMKINETSQKGLSAVQKKSELLSFKNSIQGHLMNGNKCAGEDTNSINKLNLVTGLSNDGISPPGTTVVNYRSTNNLDVITGPGADGEYAAPADTGDNTSISLAVGSPAPGAPNFNISEMRVYPDSPNNTCYVMIRVAKDAAAANTSFGGSESIIWYTLTCTLAGNNIDSCNSSSSVSEGIFQSGANGEYTASTPIAAEDTLTVGKAYNPGDTAALTIVDSTGGDYPGTPAGLNHGIDLPINTVISFGGNDALYSDGNGLIANRGFTATTNIVTGSASIDQNGTITGVAAYISGLVQGNEGEFVTDVTSNNYYYWSDERFKKDIETIQNASESLETLRGVTYFMRTEEFPDHGFNNEKKIGLIAQEVELVFPELVREGRDGMKRVDYANLVAVLIEGFKEQMSEIKKNKEMFEVMHYGLAQKNAEQDARLEMLERENSELRKEVRDLKSRLDRLEKLILKEE